MSPIEILKMLLNVDAKAARLILAGLGVLAAAAMALSWPMLNATETIKLGAWILGFGVLATLLTRVLRDDLMQRVLGWALVGAFIVYMSALLCATVFPALAANIGISPAPCLVNPLSACGQVINTRNRPAASASATSSPTRVLGPGDKVVVLPTLADRNRALFKVGDLQSLGVDAKIARREASAPVSAETVVHYSNEADKAKAEALAKGLGVSSAVPVKTLKVPAIPGANFQVILGVR